MRLRFIFLAAFAAALCACAPDNEPFLFRSALMGYLQEDGSLKGDDGRIYYFSNVQDNNGWEDVKRLMVLIDVTEKISGENTYSARLLNYEVPLYKEPVVGDDQHLIDSLGTSPLQVNDAWLAGGCINMVNTLLFADREKKHTVDLRLKEYPPSGDTLKFALMHNAGDDIVDEYAEDFSGSTFSFYSSFPIDQFLPENKDNLVLTLEWRWKGETNVITHSFK